MKNKTFNILASLIIIFISFIIPASAIPDHKPVMCDGCHTNGRFQFGQGDDDYCSCHKYVDENNKLIPQIMESWHNPNTCKACHGVKDGRAFHTIHVNETCATCHGETGSAKPDKTFNDCGGCHGGKLHDIHGEKIDQICTTCHVKVPSNTPQNSVGGSKAINRLYVKVIDYQKYTLLELIKRLFGLG